MSLPCLSIFHKVLSISQAFPQGKNQFVPFPGIELRYQPVRFSVKHYRPMVSPIRQSSNTGISCLTVILCLSYSISRNLTSFCASTVLASARLRFRRSKPIKSGEFTFLSALHKSPQNRILKIESRKMYSKGAGNV